MNINIINEKNTLINFLLELSLFEANIFKKKVNFIFNFNNYQNNVNELSINNKSEKFNDIQNINHNDIDQISNNINIINVNKVKEKKIIKENNIDINIVDKELEERLSTIENLGELKKILLNFNKCQLVKFAKNTVFGDGVENAKIMLIGEAPGDEEDESGIPFCGRSGKLLEKILKLINISREKNLFITNTIFWRPPNNRKPEKNEIDLCKPFVEKIIEIIKPDYIILSGSTATSSFINMKHGESFSLFTGKLYDYSIYNHNDKTEIIKKVKLLPIYHPAYLLRSPMMKKNIWIDLKGIFRNEI